MANTNITPSAGNLNLSDKSFLITPVTGVLLAVGLTATLVNGGIFTRTPSRGSLTLSGHSPSLSQQNFVTPSTGALTATGQTAAPSLTRTPGTGALTGTGVAAVAFQSRVIVPIAGNLTLNRGLELTPTTGTLAFTGSVPFIAPVLTPATASLTLTGASSVIAGNPVAFTPSTGSLFIGEFVGVPVTRTPATGVLTFGDALTTPLLSPSAGALGLTGQTAGRLVNSITTPLTGAVNATGVLAILQGPILRPATGSLSLIGQQAGVSRSLIPTSGSLALTGAPPSVAGFVQPIPDSGSLTLTGAAPTVIVTTSVILTPSTGALIGVGVQPITDAGRIPGTGVLALTGAAPTVPGQQFVPTTTAAALVTYQPSLFFEVFLTPRTGVLVGAGVVPNVGGVPPRGGVRFRPRPHRRIFRVPLREERNP